MNLIFLARQIAIVPGVQQYLEAADNELRRVSAITSQTLRFHKQSSLPQAITARELFSTVLVLFEGRLKNSGIVIETSYRARKPIICFEGDVRQILNNLVSNAIAASVFQPFFTTKGIAGTGLGLWVSKEVADRHHGTLRVRSSQGPRFSGSVFRLFLPHQN
jgi:signal transduction histidine kinase